MQVTSRDVIAEALEQAGAAKESDHGIGSKAASDDKPDIRIYSKGSEAIQDAERLAYDTFSTKPEFLKGKIQADSFSYNFGLQAIRGPRDKAIAENNIALLNKLKDNIESSTRVSGLNTGYNTQRTKTFGQDTKSPLEILLARYTRRASATLSAARTPEQEEALKTKINTLIDADLDKIHSNLAKYNANATPVYDTIASLGYGNIGLGLIKKAGGYAWNRRCINKAAAEAAEAAYLQAARLTAITPGSMGVSPEDITTARDPKQAAKVAAERVRKNPTLALERRGVGAMATTAEAEAVLAEAALKKQAREVGLKAAKDTNMSWIARLSRGLKSIAVPLSKLPPLLRKCSPGYINAIFIAYEVYRSFKNDKDSHALTATRWASSKISGGQS